MEPVNWQYLFSPRSVVVIGASNTRGSWGYAIIRGLPTTADRRVYPVNPKAAEVAGARAYPSVVDIPNSIDLAVIVVAAQLVPGVMRECAAKGIKAAVIISGGFSEMGEEGQKLESEALRIARQGGIRFIGPNTMGHANTRVQLSTFGQTWEMVPGHVGLLSQSGNMCLNIVRNATESGIAFSKYITTGNEADLHLEDYLEYLATDDDTSIIAAYIEGLRDGRRFFRLAREITARKPMVAIKVGGTETAAKAVKSHTGALAGSDAVYTAAFRQVGIIRVDDDAELCDVLFALINSPLPRNNRVGILSIGGGPGALSAEACEREGLAVSSLSPSTIEKLDNILPSRWSRRNPVDMGGISSYEFPIIGDCLWAMMEDDNVDIVFLQAPIVVARDMLSGRMGLAPEESKAYREQEIERLKAIRRKVLASGKPVILLGQSRFIQNDLEITTTLRQEKILVYGRARRAAKVMRSLAWYKKYVDTTKSK